MLGGTFEKNKVEGKIKAYNDKIVKENFWKDKKSAQQIVKEKTYFEEIFTSYNFVLNELITVSVIIGGILGVFSVYIVNLDKTSI